MKVIAINASPRKDSNTATLLKNALDGAAAKGAQTELVHLYDLNYTGCTSCFDCKLIGGKSYGKCAAKDDLTAVLVKIEQADAIVLGSPVYFGSITGQMRSFLERFMFQYLCYDKERTILFDKKMPAGFIYTMNVSEAVLEKGYKEKISDIENSLKRIFCYLESLYSSDTYQFDDYSKYVSSLFDEQAKAKRKKEVFPIDCQKAYEMGTRLAEKKC